MKLTEESLNLVIDILNDLICEGKMLNEPPRESWRLNFLRKR